ncbi:ArnT family glycosyltransferase [Sphingobacterium detergens]|uniref:Dolichyl-phosphate-mannose-protein mannosyltransferase n=1 Tax=Sphingobacterium detergens TaxID=1145106 RepID=A0A420BLA6_SPHD1|nr:glycosyltransferase family 39 protein [Sphingobacterium detergens]RKE57395.1 dolichyl-phosphate-mannose-protein mannosyltransferase [Sphingobacterium detergens]
MKKHLILVSLILLKFIIQYQLISPIYDLHRDEFLHLDQANHLAWGYLSVPPLTSWLSYLIKILGNSVFWIKFFPALFGALTILVVWKTIEELKGGLFALIFGTSCVIFSVLFRLNTLYQPNSFDVLSWTLIYYFIIKYLNRGHHKWLYFIAVTFALGFLNKYNIAFLILGLIPAIIAVPERKVLFNNKFYSSILIAFLIILPNLIWQYLNNFPVLYHFKELAETQLINVNRWSFIRSQFLFFFGTFPVIGFGLYALLCYPAFRKYRLFLFSFFITIGVFLFLKAKDYYAIGVYPIYFAFGAVYISTLLENKAGRILKPLLIALPLVFFIPVYLLTFPNRSPQYIANHPEKYRKIGMLTWEDGKDHQLPQDFADMLGWRELAQKVDDIYGKIPNPQNTLVLCDNYGQAGAINYYSKLGIRAVTFNADYINWFDFSHEFRNLIRIKNSWENQSEMNETAPYFVQSIRSDSITNKYAREYGAVIFTFINAKININQRVKNEVEQEQRRHLLPVK